MSTRKTKASVPTKKEVNKMIDTKLNSKIETKFVEYEKSGVVLQHHAGNVIYHELSTLVQGVDNGQRIGNNVIPQRMDIDFILRNTDSAQPPATGGSIPRMIRVAIVKSKVGALTQSDFSYLNPSGSDGFCTRFDLKKVIVKHDKVYQLGPMNTALGTEGTPYRPFANARLRYTNLSKMEFSGVLTPAILGGCYLLLWAVDNSSANTGDCGYCWSSRLSYKDA